MITDKLEKMNIGETLIVDMPDSVKATTYLRDKNREIDYFKRFTFKTEYKIGTGVIEITIERRR